MMSNRAYTFTRMYQRIQRLCVENEWHHAPLLPLESENIRRLSDVCPSIRMNNINNTKRTQVSLFYSFDRTVF